MSSKINVSNKVDLRRIKDSIYDNDDHEYFSFSFVNQSYLRVPARFQTSMTQPLLNKPNDYHMAIVSFSVDGSAIPIFTFKDNYYYCMISYNGVMYHEAVPYIDYSITTTRNIFNYQYFIDMVNKCFNNLYNTLITAQPLAATLMTSAPFFTFNPVILLISLHGSGPGIGWSGTYDDPATVNIFINNNLFNMFASFENYFIGYGYGPVDFPSYQLLFKDNLNGNKIGNSYVMLQNYPTLVNWHDISRIVLTSSSLPVNKQYTLTVNSNGNPVYLPIIASFTPEFSTGPDTRGYINYTPQFLVYNDLNNSTEIKNIDFQFYYLTKSLELVEMNLFQNQSMNLLCLFKHKSLLN